MDGVFGHHMGSTQGEKRASEIHQALVELLRLSHDANLKKLYDVVIAGGMLAAADGLLKQVDRQFAQDNRDRLLATARYFSMRAGHREAVKLGIVLLGVAGSAEDTDLLVRLGGHDEFTLFAAVALGRTAADPEQSLWEMAKRVHGWGRIQIVERLTDTHNPQIQAWMLREGYRNSVMYEYLACPCALAGRLHVALKAPAIDKPLLDGAADILRALIAGGPAENINDYEHAAEAAEGYINHVWSSRDLEMTHFLAVDSLLNFLDDSKRQPERLERGWTEADEDRIKILCRDILGREAWRSQALHDLASKDDYIFYTADLVARKLGIPTWETHFARVRAAPITSSSWFQLLRETEGDQIDEVVRFAESALPLGQIAAGPADELGLGPGFEAHRALDCVLQELPRFPGRGWNLIKAGLRSPVVRNRNLAVKAISEWPEQLWPLDTLKVLREARDIEPNAKTRQSLDELSREKAAN